MKRVISVLSAMALLISLFAGLPSNISASENNEKLGSFNISAVSKAVVGDPRFDSYMTIDVGSKAKRVQTFFNGKNANNSINLSGKIDDDSETNTSVVSFYVKSPTAATLTVSFFHTRNGVYRETKGIAVEIKKTDVWQAVTLPLKDFTYNAAGSDLNFGRFDIRYDAGVFADNSTLYVSEVQLLSSAPTTYGEADGVHFDISEITLKQTEYKTLIPVFTSSSGGTAIPPEVEWTSSDSEVATVDQNGRVTAVSDGTATICCKISDSVYAEVSVTVSGELIAEEIATFFIDGAYQTVENDPRFTKIITPQINSTTKRIIFRKNGKNDNEHADLSKFIGETPVESMAVSAFYIKTSYVGELKCCFFHTKGGVYNETSQATFNCDGKDDWQLVILPMSQFTYTGNGDPVFPRFDVVFSAGTFKEGDTLQFSEIKVLTAPPKAIYDADAMHFENEKITLKQNETAQLSPVFTTSKDGEALPQTVTYSSSATDIVTVSQDGKLRAISQGNAVITGESAVGLKAYCMVTVNGVGEIKEYGTFSRSEFSEDVKNDPRFKNEIKLAVSSELKRFYFFANGKNDNMSVDLSEYISKPGMAVICFYIKTNYKGNINTCFFHTKGGIYKDTDTVSFTSSGTGEWERICLPLSKYKYNGLGKAEFGRFDFVFKAGQLSDNMQMSVSEVRVLSIEPEEYFPAEGVSLPQTELVLRVNEYNTLKPIFTSSKGVNVLPGEMEWSSSAPEIVSVDNEGIILGKGEGKAEITGKMKNGNSVSLEVIVSRRLEIKEKARFTVSKYQKSVSGDPRYDAIIKYPVTSATSRIQLFRNGKSDNQSYNLSDYIGKTSKNTQAYLYFYIYSPVTGNIGLNFFHTKGGVYKSTNSVNVKVNAANVWQAVCVPMSSFTYNGGDDFNFGRFDITCKKGTFADNSFFKVSPVRIMSSRPIIPQLVKAQRLTLNVKSRTMPAETALQLSALFSADNGTAAAEDVVWHSSNNNVASVDEKGYVKTWREGSAVITAKSEESELSAECRITVTQREPSVARWSMDRSYIWSTANIMRSFQEAENDPRFTDYLTVVSKNGEDYQFQLFQKTSAVGDISDCIDFGVIRFWVKVPRDNTVFDLSLTSNKGSFYSGSKRFKVKVTNSDGWQRIEIPISELEFSGDFIYSRVKFVSVASVKENQLKKGESNLQAGDTLKIAGLQILNHSPNDPKGPVFAPVKSISLDSDYITMELGSRHKLEYVINPQNADQSVTFVNRNTDALTVDANGIILARAAGKYKISVITDSGHKKADCTIEVKPIDANAPSKCIFEVNFAKGKWNDVKDGSFATRIKTLEKSDENYYRFKREMYYSVVKPDTYYGGIGSRFTMFYGDMVGKTSLSYLKLNVEPYIESATVRFWAKSPRAGIRMMVGFNDRSYATAKYNYTISKADEWVEIRLPLKDILAQNKKFNLNELRNLIVSTAVDITKDSPAALREGEEIEFGYFQIWTGKPEDVVYTELDESRYFYDDSDDDIWIVDRNMVLPQLTSVKFLFENRKTELEGFANAVKPCTVQTSLQVYAIGMNSGKKYGNDSLYKPVEVWIKSSHPAIKDADTDKLGVGVYKDGCIKLVKSEIKDDCLVFEINSYDRLVFLNLNDEIIQILKSGKRPVFNTILKGKDEQSGMRTPIIALITVASVIIAGTGTFAVTKCVKKIRKGAKKC